MAIKRALRLIVLIQLCLLISTYLLASDKSIGRWINTDQFDFAIALYDQGEYYRSITEVMRVNDSGSSEKFSIERAYILFANYYKTGDTQQIQSISKRIRSEKRGGDTAAFKRYALNCETWHYIDNDKLELAWARISNTIDKTSPFKDSSLIDEKKSRLHSSFIPGSGFIQSGEYIKAFSAFTLNALFLTGIYQSITIGSYATAALLGFFEIGWYRGGMNAAEESVKNRNRRTIKENIQKIALENGLTCPL